MFLASGRRSGSGATGVALGELLGEPDAARAFGRCFAMTIHPRLMAWGGRLTFFEEAPARLRESPRVCLERDGARLRALVRSRVPGRHGARSGVERLARIIPAA
jgi:hypothetical protein